MRSMVVERCGGNECYEHTALITGHWHWHWHWPVAERRAPQCGLSAVRQRGFTSWYYFSLKSAVLTNEESPHLNIQYIVLLNHSLLTNPIQTKLET